MGNFLNVIIFSQKRLISNLKIFARGPLNTFDVHKNIPHNLLSRFWENVRSAHRQKSNIPSAVGVPLELLARSYKTVIPKFFLPAIFHSFPCCRQDLALVPTKKCPKSGLACSGKCGKDAVDVSGMPVHVQLEGAEWFRVVSVKQLFETLALVGDKTYMLVGGNTAHGMFLWHLIGNSKLRNLQFL